MPTLYRRMLKVLPRIGVDVHNLGVGTVMLAKHHDDDADDERSLQLAAASYLEQRGATVRTGAKVAEVARHKDGWRVDAVGHAVGGTWSVYVDAVVIATPPPAAAVLLKPLGRDELTGQLLAFDYEPITTCYLKYESGQGIKLARPFYALEDDPRQGRWGQFVFDRGQLDPSQAGLLAVVISAARDAAALGQGALGAAVAGQLAAVFRLEALARPEWCQVITEKRATFACAPGLQRPGNATGIDGLVLAGDYTASDYPATLESAIRSGLGAAALIGGKR